MSAQEAKSRIISEFINGFYEWIEDTKEIQGIENNSAIIKSNYAKKYDYFPATSLVIKDNQKCLIWYQKYIFTGRWLHGWEKAGYDKYDIWELHKGGFLSLNEYGSWEARAKGHTAFYYISQATAKAIYNEYKRRDA